MHTVQHCKCFHLCVITSKSKVSSRIRVASLEAWGSVAICLVHSDTVFVSLVVRGTAALISTSAAFHTYTQPTQHQADASTMFAHATTSTSEILFQVTYFPHCYFLHPNNPFVIVVIEDLRFTAI